MADKKVISLKKRRNMGILKRVFMIIRIPVVILAVVAALFLSARLLGNVAVSNVTDGIRQIKTVFTKGEGYPHSLEAFNFKRIAAIGGKPLVLYNDSSLVLSSSAGEIFSMPLNNADSRVITKNGRALIYSATTGSEAVLQSKTERLGSVTPENAISCAALAGNGSIATAHSTDGYASVLTVYNKRFKKVFQWNCALERIADISLSSNGKKIAVIAVGAENAEIYTRLLLFDIGSAEPASDIKYSGTLFLRVVYTDSGKIIAAGDNMTVVLGNDGVAVDKLEYPENGIIAFSADDSGNSAICYEELGGSKAVIVRYSKSGKKTCTVTVDGIPDFIASSGRKIAVATGSRITVYSSNGEISKEIEASCPISQLLFSSGNIYTVENGSVYKY